MENSRFRRLTALAAGALLVLAPLGAWAEEKD